MDMKAALNILNLNADATLTDAKKAYRNLAKQYHPDLGQKNNLPEWKAEAKMKDINLAFRCLAPLLKSNKSPKKTIKKSEHGPNTVNESSLGAEKKRRDPFMAKIVEFFAVFFHTQDAARPPERKIKKEQTGKGTPYKTARFEDIFKQAHNNDLNGKVKRKKTKGKKDSYQNRSSNVYREYMVLKQKVKSGQSSRNKAMSIGKVTRIEPIKPVRPVGEI